MLSIIRRMRVIHYFRRDWLVPLVLAVFLSVAPAATLEAQSEAASSRPWKVGLATGPSFFYGDEGNTTGLQLESTLMRRVYNNRTWLRLEMTSHLYGAQTLYPCALIVNGTCFSTSQRSVFGGGLGVQYFFRDPSRPARPVPHLVVGIATYVSTRNAEQPLVCQPSTLCADVVPSHKFTDTDFGVNIGFGQTWRMGRNEFFIESRLHQPIVRQHPSAPNSGFRMLPLSFGVRF